MKTWRECTKAISHERTGSSCYNPLQLQFMEGNGAAGQRHIYIACTYTSMWSSWKGLSGGDHRRSFSCELADYGGANCAEPVPRYEYNNLVYRIDLGQLYPKARSGATSGNGS